METKPFLTPVIPKKPVSIGAPNRPVTIGAPNRPVSIGAPNPPVTMGTPNRSVPRASRSDLYYYSYNELGESDQQLLSDYWKVIDQQFQPVSPEMANLVLGLTDFPPLPSAKGASDDHSVSMSERLLGCLIPEDESRGIFSFPLSCSVPIPRVCESLLHNQSGPFSETDPC